MGAYSADAKDTGGMTAGPGTGVVATSGGRDVLGVWALDHSSSESLNDVRPLQRQASHITPMV